MLEPSLVLVESIKLLQVLLRQVPIEPELELNPFHVSLPRVSSLPLINIKDGHEPAYLVLTELDLYIFLAQ